MNHATSQRESFYAYDVLKLVALLVVTPPLIYFDVREHRLPNLLTYGYAALGLIWCSALRDWKTIGLAAGVGLSFGLLSLNSRFMGMGDTKLMLGLTLWFGRSVLAAFVCASALAFAWAVIGVCRGSLAWQSRIPFGPFLLVGVWLTIYP